MGQRHQVYLNLPPVFFNAGNPNNRGPKVVGFHHQWLYGWRAVRSLDRAIRFFDKTKDEKFGLLTGTAREAGAALAALYSVEEATGYYHGVHEFQPPRTTYKDGALVKLEGDWELANPFAADNNDGITVIEHNGPRGRWAYCFYSLGNTEGEIPLARGCYEAAHYLLSYYPTLTKDQEFLAEATPVLARLAQVPVLDEADMKRIFPALDPAGTWYAESHSAAAE